MLQPISNSECKHGMDGYMINSSPDGQTLVESEQWKEGTPEQRKMLLAREHYTKADHKYCKVCAAVKSLLTRLTFSGIEYVAFCCCAFVL